MYPASNSVYLEKCPDYTEQKLGDCCERVLAPNVSPAALRTTRILLKPNLITARMGTLPCTEGRFIIAAAKWFLDHNVRLSIGDSPAFGTTTSVLKKIGVYDELRCLPITIVDFTQTKSIPLPSGIQVGIATEALDCDLLVNMPRVKAHSQLRVTLAVKNLFGCVVGMRKPLWHMVHGGKCGGFTDYLAELLTVLPNTLTLVDGINAMHVTGPIGGKAFSLGVVACSPNPVAIDRALLDVIGLAPDQSPLMQSCVKKRLPGIDLGTLDFPLYSPEEVATDCFIVPDSLVPVRFDPFRFIQGTFRRLVLTLCTRSE